MTHKFTNVLNHEELRFLDDLILFSPYMKDETSNSYYANTQGAALAEADIFANRIEQLVKSVYSHPIRFSNNFCRIYKNNSRLGIHTDRPGLDITVSLCVRKDSQGNWPLNISNKIWHGPWNDHADHSLYLSDYVSVNLEPGDIAVCLGTRQPHWRDTLTCADNQRNIYVFYHWSDA